LEITSRFFDQVSVLPHYLGIAAHLLSCDRAEALVAGIGSDEHRRD